MQEDIVNEVESTEAPKAQILGKYKPKRKFLNFVSAVSGMKVRFISDVAFVKGEKLSGMLEGAVFKITICDEGTINFDEVDTELSNEAMIQRLIDEIDDTDVTGYAQKFIVYNLEFKDKDGARCYLEVEHQTPIDKLKTLFESTDAKLSQKGSDFLDDLFSNSPNSSEAEYESKESSIEDEINSEDLKNNSDQNDDVSENKETYMEESFRKMNEGKIEELKNRISNKEKEIQKAKREIEMAEKKLTESSGDLGILETRLDTMQSKDDANGYVFFVSEEQKNDIGLSEENREMADKIATLMNLKKDVLFKIITEGFYNISIGQKEDICNKEFKIDKEIFQKLSVIDPMGKITMISDSQFQYRGEYTWHQIVSKLIKRGFEQSPDFDKQCNSNSYDSNTEDQPAYNPIDENLTEEEISEFKNEFYQTNGYQIGDDYVFALEDNENTLNKYVVCVNPKSYWDKSGYLYDGHVSSGAGGILELPGFEELSEAVFTYTGTKKEAIQTLIQYDMKFDPKFQDYIQTSYLVDNTIMINDFIENTYSNSIV